MNLKTQSIRVALLISLLAMGSVHAAGKIYVGAKVGVADADIAGADNAYVVGVYGGYNLLGKDSQYNQDLHGGTLAVEGEVLLTAIKGDTTNGDWDLKSFGVYAAYRHPLTDYFYLKGKLGIARNDIDANPAVNGDGADTKLAAGIGAGWKVGPGRLEAELTTYEGDVLLLSAGFHMAF